MRKTVSAVFLAVVMAFGVGNAYAATTTFDFESFADGTNITGVNIGGATITRGGDEVQVTSNVPGGRPLEIFGAFRLPATIRFEPTSPSLMSPRSRSVSVILIKMWIICFCKLLTPRILS